MARKWMRGNSQNKMKKTMNNKKPKSLGPKRGLYLPTNFSILELLNSSSLIFLLENHLVHPFIFILASIVLS